MLNHRKQHGGLFGGLFSQIGLLERGSIMQHHDNDASTGRGAREAARARRIELLHKNGVGLAHKNDEELYFHLMAKSKCSALVRLTDGYKDVVFAHNAWADYSEM